MGNQPAEARNQNALDDEFAAEQQAAIAELTGTTTTTAPPDDRRRDHDHGAADHAREVIAELGDELIPTSVTCWETSRSHRSASTRRIVVRDPVVICVKARASIRARGPGQAGDRAPPIAGHRHHLRRPEAIST
ncbi:MAG: hypothetical protein R2710_12615 [Acidimicrobiales bacterium]